MNTKRALLSTLSICMVLSGCTIAATTGRFKDQPIVWRVDDTKNIPEPKKRPFLRYSYYLDAYVFDRFNDRVDPPNKVPALDTNALDELPDSSWFTNRIGHRSVKPEEAARGPGFSGPPELPITIFAAKSGGANPGFFAKDNRGIRYLVKFDEEKNPEQQTAGDVIVNRIFWTLGYHVPSDNVFFFHREELRIGEKVADKLTSRDIDTMLLGATHTKDGRIRALASEFVPGIPKGGWPGKGVRDDDPNDTIPHQHRRALRALFVFSAWLGHTDLKEDNSIDVYMEEDGKKFFRHFLVDFGEALGGHQSEKGLLSIGWEYGFDWRAQAIALASFGLYVRPWENQKETPWKSIGHFSAQYFDAPGWRERYYYEPFHYVRKSDAFWAAKLIMKFDRPMLEAIVAAGEFSEAAAASYLVETLLARAWNIGYHYLDQVTPLDDFRFVNGKLCASDLTRKYELVKYGVVEILDESGEVHAKFNTSDKGAVCIPIAGDDTYRVLRVRIRRVNGRTPPMQIHYKGGENARILGIIRD